MPASFEEIEEDAIRRFIRAGTSLDPKTNRNNFSRYFWEMADEGVRQHFLLLARRALERADTIMDDMGIPE